MREASRCIGKNNGISAGKQTIKRLFTPILALLIALALLSSSVFAIKQLISLQGKVDFNGVLVDNGNLTVSIHDSAAGGAQLYIDYFNNTIQDGFFDVMLGNGTTLDLNLSQTYYMDLSINGTDLDFDGNERKIFQSPVGYKLSGAENFTVDTNVLFVDSLNDRVGIGTTGPSRRLAISSPTTSTNNQLLYLQQSGADYGYSFNIDDSVSGHLFLKGVQAGVEGNIMTFEY